MSDFVSFKTYLSPEFHFPTNPSMMLVVCITQTAFPIIFTWLFFLALLMAVENGQLHGFRLSHLSPELH